jgi:hypothetical protein
MANDRPLFDDEDLPGWLKDAGITHGQGESTQPEPASQADLPWLTDDLADMTEPEAPAVPTSPDDLPPWMHDAAPAEPEPATSAQSPVSGSDDLQIDWGQDAAPEPQQPPAGVAGALPWRQGAADNLPVTQSAPQSGSTENRAEDEGWMEAFPSRADLPAQSQTEGTPSEPPSRLKGLKSLSRPSEPPQSPASQPAAPSGDLGWPNEPPSEQAAPPTPQPAAPDDDLGWLDTALGTVPAEPETGQPTADVKPIKRLPRQEAPPAEPPPTQPAIKRLPKAGPVQPDLSNLTYEQWEQAQIAKEQEAQSDPADKLLDEVPEWFNQAAQMPMPADTSASSGPELLPDWYVGLEEQSNADVPDWFANLDVNGTPLAGPQSVQTPQPETPSVPETTPDWFQGAGVGNLDFEAMFGGQAVPPEEAPKPATKLADHLPEPPAQEVEVPDLDNLFGEPEPLVPPQTATPETTADLDWMNQPISATSASNLADLVDWMQSDEAAKAAEPAPAPSEPLPAQAEVPDWLNEPAPTASAASDTAAPEPADSGTPDWMQDWAGSSPVESQPAANQPEPAAADIPEWMRDLTPAEPAASTGEAPPKTEAEAVSQGEPDWLSDLQVPQPSPSAEAAAPPAPEQPKPFEPTPAAQSENVPIDIDKLLNLSPEEYYIPSPAPVVPVDKDAQSLSTMDADFDLDAVFDLDVGEKKPEPEAIDLDALTEALPPPPVPTGDEPPRSGRLRRVTPGAAAAPETPKPREELPDWIAEMAPGQAPTALQIGDQVIRLKDKPAAPMTDQLRQLRERGRALQQRKAEAASPTAGPLAGILGAIETIPELTQPGTSLGSIAPVISDAQSKRVKLIQKILEVEEALLQERALSEDEREAKQAAAVGQRVPGARPRLKIDRILISLVLAAIIVAPFFTNVLAPAVPQPPNLSQLSSAGSAVAGAIDGLPEDQPVLVAFEYGPTGSGELDDLARIALRDIIRRKARPIIVSTNPSGALHAQSLMAVLGSKPDELKMMGRGDSQPLVARQDYVVLRYLPGGAAGVRAALNAILAGGFQQSIVFATDIEGKPTGLTEANLSGLKSNPAFVLTESAEDVRNWVEQYQSAPPNKPLPIVLLSSAGASAAAQAYAQNTAGQRIVGPLVGLRDALVYQAVRQPQSTNAQNLMLQRWQSVGLGAMLAATVIILGAAVNMIRSLRSPQRRARR